MPPLHSQRMRVDIWIDAGPLLRPTIVGSIAYLGLRGSEVLFMGWFGAKLGKGD